VRGTFPSRVRHVFLSSFVLMSVPFFCLSDLTRRSPPLLTAAGGPRTLIAPLPSLFPLSEVILAQRCNGLRAWPFQGTFIRALSSFSGPFHRRFFSPLPAFSHTHFSRCNAPCHKNGRIRFFKKLDPSIASLGLFPGFFPPAFPSLTIHLSALLWVWFHSLNGGQPSTAVSPLGTLRGYPRPLLPPGLLIPDAH